MGGLLHTGLALVFTLFILYLAKKGAETFLNKQRLSQAGKEEKGAIRIVSVKRLDHRKSLVLVEENGYEHLLLVSPNRDVPIHSRHVTVAATKAIGGK